MNSENLESLLGHLFIVLCCAGIFIFLCTAALAYHAGDRVQLATEKGCSACQEAKQDLYNAHIPFKEIKSFEGYFVPQLYVNGKYRGTGVGAVERYINER